MDLLNFKPKNILSEDDVDTLSEYWCDADDTRDENLGEFIQRVAEIGMQVQELKNINKDIDEKVHLTVLDYAAGTNHAKVPFPSVPRTMRQGEDEIES